MKENIVPGYLPAAAVSFTPPDGGETVTVFRPYEAFTLSELEQHAAEKERGALYQLGERYYRGILGAEQDYEKAYEYLKQAAELGVQDAQALLADYYISDQIGLLQRDPQKCLDLLIIAAENGSWRAMEKLTMAYRSGVGGMPVDHEKAYEWAEQMERMVRIYWAFYTQPNFVDFKEKQKEILHAHTRAALTLVSYHADGIGTKRDLNAAMKWVDLGEQFVCQATGLAKVPIFQSRRAQIQERFRKDTARAKKAEREAKKKKR